MKAGRHKKNIYDCLRFQRMHEWAGCFSKLNNYQIAKRMYERDDKNLRSLDAFKGLIHHIKMGNLARTQPYYIWLMARALLTDDLRKEKGKSIITPQFRWILYTLCSKLHARISEDFVCTGANDKDGFIFRSYNYHSDISWIDVSPLEISELFGKIFGPDDNFTLDLVDISIDIAELLNAADGADGDKMLKWVLEDVNEDVNIVLEAINKALKDFIDNGIRQTTVFRAKEVLFHDIIGSPDINNFAAIHSRYDPFVNKAVRILINHALCQYL